MRFEIGSKVVLIDGLLKGVVTALKGDFVEVQDEDGMRYQFHKKELMLQKRDQYELSKFSDINHPLLKEKAMEKRSKKSFFAKEKNEVIFEVDLHIHELVDSTRGLDNYEMLHLQLTTAQQKMEFAIEKKFSKVVFIHGVGEGVLKSELHHLLSKYPVDFYDASYQKYGLGATEVYIYQNPKSL